MRREILSGTVMYENASYNYPSEIKNHDMHYIHLLKVCKQDSVINVNSIKCWDMSMVDFISLSPIN